LRERRALIELQTCGLLGGIDVKRRSGEQSRSDKPKLS
jgi:hypothetical protein